MPQPSHEHGVSRETRKESPNHERQTTFRNDRPVGRYRCHAVDNAKRAGQYTLLTEPELMPDGIWQATATLAVANQEPKTILFRFTDDGTPADLENLGFERR